jgi:hypothetical protein
VGGSARAIMRQNYDFHAGVLALPSHTFGGTAYMMRHREAVEELGTRTIQIGHSLRSSPRVFYFLDFVYNFR